MFSSTAQQGFNDKFYSDQVAPPFPPSSDRSRSFHSSGVSQSGPAPSGFCLPLLELNNGPGADDLNGDTCLVTNIELDISTHLNYTSFTRYAPLAYGVPPEAIFPSYNAEFASCAVSWSLVYDSRLLNLDPAAAYTRLIEDWEFPTALSDCCAPFRPRQSVADYYRVISQDYHLFDWKCAWSVVDFEAELIGSGFTIPWAYLSRSCSHVYSRRLSIPLELPLRFRRDPALDAALPLAGFWLLFTFHRPSSIGGLPDPPMWPSHSIQVTTSFRNE